MLKWSSYITRFLLLFAVCVMCMTAFSFGLSAYLYTDSANAAAAASLTESLRIGRDLLDDYAAGTIGQTELRAALNPAVNPDGNFYMLLDAQANVLAYTEAGVPYFVSTPREELVRSLKEDGAATVHAASSQTPALLMGMKTAQGYVLAGRPMRAVSSGAFKFRSRLMLSMGALLLLILVLSIMATRKVARPARIITETAARLIDGEQVLLPENLPSMEMREIANAFNHMSREVAKSFQALRNEKDTMALILEGLNEGILAVGENGDILHENTAARGLLGGEETDAYRTVLSALKETAGEAQRSGKLPAGNRILFYAVTPLPGADIGRRGTVALIRDITEQEHLERTRHDYVANISHELRTPLASMRGLAEGLRDGLVTDPKDQQRYFNIIVGEVTRLSRLVNDLLELSSLQSNPAAFEMETIDPNELIYELQDLNEQLFAKKGLRFLRSLPDEPLPDIRSNEDRLSQVLTIFLDNARKYTPAGGEVTIGAERAAGGVRFFVRDTGVGMDEETQRLAFERFHQAERGRSDQGSGLGLSIAREILQKLGVEIMLQSAPGKGSEFSFVIAGSADESAAKRPNA